MPKLVEKSKPNRAKKVPDYLIYETIDGKPIYYRGYQSVLSGKKTLEEIIGCSSLQSVIIAYLLRIMYRKIDEANYYVLTNEIGNHISLGNNLSNDIAIYDKKILTAEKINSKYSDVPPRIAIEVDNEADMSEFSEIGYISKKSKKMIDFGVEKIIWVLTNIKSVLIIEPNQDWQVKNWYKEIEIMDGLTFNIGKYLDAEGIIVAEN
jgi:Uma2 family endonuclease